MAVESPSHVTATGHDGSPVRSAAGSNAIPALLALAAVALVAIAAWRALDAFGFRLTDEDQMLYWYAAQEFGHLHFREPFFYGQPYLPMLESLVMAPLVGLGMHLWDALPLVSTLLGLFAWGVIAARAWRRGQRAVALLLAGGPLLLPPAYLFQLEVPFNSGTFVAGLAVLAADLCRGERLRGLLFGLLAGLAVLFVLASSAILLVPAGVLFAFERGDLARRWQGLVAGGALAGAVTWAAGLFYQLHPGWIVSDQLAHQPGLSRTWTLRLLVDGLTHLDRHLGFFGPWFHPSGVAPLAALALIAAAAAVRRHRLLALAAALTLAAVVASLGLEKVHDGEPGVFFSYDRAYVAVPLAIALLLASWPAGHSPRLARWQRPAAAAAALVVAIAFVASLTALPAAAARYSVFPTVVYTGPRPVASVRAECSAVQLASAATGSTLVVFLQTRGFAYGCGALFYGRLTTLYPSYERRTWLLQQEDKLPRDAVLFAEVSPSFCRQAAAAGAGCRLVGDGIALVRPAAPEPAVDLIRRLGVPVRPF